MLPFIQHPDHPRFFARIGSPSNFVSVLADAAASGFNVFAGSWTGGSGPATVELVVLDWLRELCGLPEGADGVLVSGGSVASLVALAAARTARSASGRPSDAVVYVSSEGHASIPRALRVLGLRYEVVPARDDHRLHADDVRAAIEATGRRALLRRGDRRHHEHRRRRPAGGAGRPRPLAARRRRVRRAGRAVPARSPGSTAPTRSCSTRTSGCSSRTRSAAC